MAYIINPTVKSSLDIGGKVVTWNEQEVNKLIEEKEEFLAKKEAEVVQENEPEEVIEVVEENKIELKGKRKGQVKKYE